MSISEGNDSQHRRYMTALQAVVRIMILQAQKDVAAGLDTAGFVSGYRGSPVAGLDAEFWSAGNELERNRILFQPGLNEDLAATSVAGSQLVGETVKGKHAGVFGLWYAKSPGVDRSGDAIRHGNYAGTARLGGVLAVAGDDPGAKSSSIANQSDQAFQSWLMPVLYPATVQDIVDFGMFGFALSRYSGCWIGFKTVSDTVEASGTASLDPRRWQFAAPADFVMPDQATHPLPGYNPLRDEQRLLDFRLPGAQAFARANGIDRTVFGGPSDRIGIVCSGKTYLDVRQALRILGIDAREAAALGIRLLKVGMTWPIDPVTAWRFAQGLEELFFIEEKQPFMEAQFARILYGRAGGPRRIVGKEDEAGQPLVPAKGELSPMSIAPLIAGRLRQFGAAEPDPEALARLAAMAERAAALTPPTLERTMFFCSGCPHNTSTQIPEGSRAMAGIGCSSMAMLMPERSTTLTTQMGGEGANWIGQAPFAQEKHVFQNLGDGTFTHSGALAIRAAVAAEVNITYKVLYNDAVAMTGGQPIEGGVTVYDIARQVHAERVRRLVLVSDDTEKYDRAALPPGTDIRHRRELDAVQRELRDTPGVTALLYDQTCAAEKRRRRKRGEYPDPPRRLFINTAVCEGCGDCSRASNCISVAPVETDFGRKRKIDQSSCNKDYSCVEGFCPSFVSVHGGRPRALAAQQGDDAVANAAALPAPAPVPVPEQGFNIMVAGIGGTGIITLGSLIARAAFVAGHGVTVLDETGIAQKNGSVTSHIRIQPALDCEAPSRIGIGEAALLLGCDPIVSATKPVLGTLAPATARAVVNHHMAPPAKFVTDNAVDLRASPVIDRIRACIGKDRVLTLDSVAAASALMGESIYANLYLLGFALQKGLLPFTIADLEQAIRESGLRPEEGLRALAWGRLAASDATAAGPAPVDMAEDEVQDRAGPAFAERMARFLRDYQNEAYACSYLETVQRAADAEAAAGIGSTAFSRTVAQVLAQLMAYKDEYEVARLYARRDFREELDRQFEGDFRVTVHLAPPILSLFDRGKPRKREFGPWVLRLFPLLARAKGLRGTPFDIFGYTRERRTERALVAEYHQLVARLCGRLTAGNYDLACRIAGAYAAIRGYGHVKAANLERARRELKRLQADFDAGPAAAPARTEPVA